MSKSIAKSVSESMITSNIDEMCNGKIKYSIEDIENVLAVMKSIDEAIDVLEKNRILRDSSNDTNHERLIKTIKFYEETSNSYKRKIKLLKKISEIVQYQEVRHLIEQEPLNISDIISEISKINAVEKLIYG